MEQYPVAHIKEIIGLARLVGGSVVTMHDQPVWLCSNDVEPPEEDRFSYKVEQEMTFRWEDQEADLGMMYIVGWNLTAETAAREGHEDHDDFKVTPADGSKWLASFDQDALLAAASGLPESDEVFAPRDPSIS